MAIYVSGCPDYGKINCLGEQGDSVPTEESLALFREQ